MNTELKHISSTINQYMDTLSDNNHFNGAVLVAYKGEILLKKGYGMSNFQYDIPNTSKTKFRIASITKGFTALAIVKLEEKGLLNIGDTIDRYLPDFPNGQLITIHNLLIHTSGIFNFVATAEFWEKDMRLYTPTLEELIALFKDKPLEFKPGEKFNYSNSDYVLLLAIIEKVTGLSYEDYLKKEILDVISAFDTGFDNGRSIVKNTASGYSVWKDIINAEFADMSKTRGGYGMFSTVEDLYLWDRSLYSDLLVSKGFLNKIFTAYHSCCGGYGWHVEEQIINGLPRKRASHFGDISGFVNNFVRYIEEDLVVIILSNLNITPVEELSDSLARIVLGEQVDWPQNYKPITLTKDMISKYEGTYLSLEDNHSKFIIDYDEGNLYISTQKRYGAWYKYKIIPVFSQEGTTKFLTDIVEEYLIFTEHKNMIRLEYNDIFGRRSTAEFKCSNE